MTVVPYVASLHAETIRAWKAGYGQIFYHDDLPKLGFVVPDVAAAWLISTDTKGAYIDSMVANPKASPRAKVRALSELLEAMQLAAYKLGYAYICGYTDERSVKGVAEKHGAASLPHRYTYLRRCTRVSKG